MTVVMIGTRLAHERYSERTPDMLWTLILVLLVLWLLGVVTSYTLGGVLHLLLVVAVVVLIVRLIQGRSIST
jgi:hypothetical protein